MQIYLAAAPSDVQAAARCACPLAHAAYRIGPDSTLLRQSLLLQSRGGLLSVSDREAPPIRDADALCAAVLRECGRRGYQGVLADFDQPPQPDRQVFLRRLGEQLAASRRTLFLPERYGDAGISAVRIIGTAVSGGSFQDHLRQSAQHWGGADRCALDVERLRMDFPLPCPTGLGEPLTAEDLETRLRESPPFFSQELCARYCTYTRDGQLHFVLFDDAGTLRQKLRTGTAMGFAAAFLMWPEVRDLAGELFRGGAVGAVK